LLNFRESSKEYYEKGNNHEKLVQCYYNLEDYEALDGIVNQLPEGHALLPVIADRLASVGLCEQAVKAYIKVSSPKISATW
jgi:WD repeat-containing protein 35